MQLGNLTPKYNERCDMMKGNRNPVAEDAIDPSEMEEWTLASRRRDEGPRQKGQSPARFADETPYPVLRVVEDGRIVYANPASVPLLRTWDTGEDRRLPAGWRDLLRQVFRTGSTRKAEAIVGDQVFSLTFVPIPGEDYANIYGLDVTERRRAEDALRESENTLRTLIDSASTGILLVGEDGRIQLANAMIEETFGYAQEALVGRSIDLLVPKAARERHAEHWRRYFEAPRIRPMGIGLDLAARHKDGGEFPVEISLSYVETRQGTVVMAFVTDITWRKKAEQELQAYSERLEEMVEERTRDLRQAQAQLLAQQRLQQEVELAAYVQASLLPRAVPSIDGYAFAATARPARYVSGDIYDFITTEAGACHIVLADIAGKGIPAALLSSAARTLVRAETAHEESPGAILTNVGRSFYDDLNQAEMFITFLVARLTPRWATLTYANAGHVQTLHWRAVEETVELLPATGMPIGVLPDTAIEERTQEVCPGDLLVFSSDGIIEAADAAGELFGMDRLIATLTENADRSASELVRTIVSAVEAFCGQASRSDDLTLVVLQALPRTLSFAYPATLAYLNEVTGLTRRATAPYGDDFAYQMELAASEIVTNVIEHAYDSSSGEIRGRIELAPRRVSIDLYDDGQPFDPQERPTLPEGALREGGYGLLVAEKLTDELSYEPATSLGNHWRLTKWVAKEVLDGASNH